ncbi:MAG: mandelate racemase/muconate lactonizing enzyme family protein [Gemmatimonadetes bacterium]|nr:mandelate racemase/muconate lactonizing enzyme family protein [Gemmatimonadota bacterium]
MEAPDASAPRPSDGGDATRPPTASRIASVEAIPVVTHTVDASDLDGSAETVLVRITDEAGRVGHGEADASGEVVQAFLEMADLHAWSLNPIDLLTGRDPFPIRAIYDALYEGTIYPGRRGLGIHALSAIDVALHDLVGKQLGRPVFELLGGRAREALTPYATIFPGLPNGRTLPEMLDAISALFDQALELGFRAVKMEVLFYDLVTDRELVDAIVEGRRRLGHEITMLVDFGYRWHDWRAAEATLARLEDQDIWLAEAPLQDDDIDGHRRLAEHVRGIRIGGAEIAATRFECREWVDRARVDVLQADISRAGGFTEMMRIADYAHAHGVLVVPHGWKSGITAAASTHFHAAHVACPLFEFLHPDLFPSPIRSEMTTDRPVIRDGVMEHPPGPGLGIEIDDDFVARHRQPRRGGGS